MLIKYRLVYRFVILRFQDLFSLHSVVTKTTGKAKTACLEKVILKHQMHVISRDSKILIPMELHN